MGGSGAGVLRLLGKLKSEGGGGDGDDDKEREDGNFFEIRAVGHVDLTMNYLPTSVNLGFEVKWRHDRFC